MMPVLSWEKGWWRKATDKDAYTSKSTRQKGKQEYQLQSAVGSQEHNAGFPGNVSRNCSVR